MKFKDYYDYKLTQNQKTGDIMGQNVRKERIWELDALRGIFVIGMVIVHIAFDLETFGGMKLPYSLLFSFIGKYGFAGFLLISGACAAFSRNSAKRGLLVFSAGMLFTAVTYLLMFLKVITKDLVISFGILHLIGASMISYRFYKKLPAYKMAALGIFIIAVGIYFGSIRVSTPYLFPFGLRTKSYAAGDYYPVFPYMGVFILGTVLGKLIYKEKKSRMPGLEKYFKFFSFAGRNAMVIYILHQPVIYGVLSFIKFISG